MTKKKTEASLQVFEDAWDGNIPDEFVPLPAEMDSLRGFEFFDGKLRESIDDEYTAKMKQAFALHYICAHSLYRHAIDETGEELYATQEEYLDAIDQYALRSKSTIKRDNSAIQMAINSGMSLKQIAERGIETVSKVFEAVITDRKTFEPIRPKNADLRPGQTVQEWVVDAINTLGRNGGDTALNLRSGDRQRAMHQVLTPKIAEVRLFRNADTTVQWCHTVYDTEGNEIRRIGNVGIEIFHDHDKGGMMVSLSPDQDGVFPNEVIGYVFRALRIEA